MDNLIHNRGPVLTDKTTLDEIKKAGADRLADIPLSELLEFVRNQCLQVATDMNEHGEWWNIEPFSDAASSVQEAMDHLQRFAPNKG